MIIYWSIPRYVDEIFLGIEQPKPAFIDFKSICPQTSLDEGFANFLLCPSVTDFSRNLFSLKSPINLEFMWNGKEVMFQDSFSDEFFKKIITVRDPVGGAMSLQIIPYFFFTEDDCEMQYTAPLLGSNDFIQKCTVIPGQVNIGKWFRPTDHAFLIRSKNQKISINKNDTIANVRFLTREKITFKKFYFTDLCEEYWKKVIGYRHSQKNIKILNYFEIMYSSFARSHLKGNILKEIKNNIME